MSGQLTYTPSRIIRQLLIDLSQATLPSASGSWLAYATNEPDTPDNCITVYDTSPVMHGRDMINGRMFEHYGIQVRIRSADSSVGEAKGLAIIHQLDQHVANASVTVGSSTYVVNAITRSTGLITLGQEPESSRSLFTINAVVALRQTT